MVVKNNKGVVIIAHNGKRELEITRRDDGLLVSPIKYGAESRVIPFSEIGIKVNGPTLFSGNVRFSEIAIQEQLISIAHGIGINLPGSEAAKASYIIMADIPSVRVSALAFVKSLSKINEKLYALASIPD